MTTRTRLWTWRILRWLLAIVFAWAAVLKVADPQGFVAAIKHYEILPLWSLHAAALLLPWFELVCAAALVAGRWTDEAAVVLMAMLAVYVVSIVSTFVRGIELTDCGCFGEFDTASPTIAVVRDIIFLAIGVGAVLTNPGRTPGPADASPSDTLHD